MAAHRLSFILALSLSLGLVLAQGNGSGRCRCSSLAEVAFPSVQEDKCEVTPPPALNPPRVIQLDILERAWDFPQYNNAFMAVLFHASWCPFSKTCRSLFDVLSLLFPNVYHVAVEDSAVMPSVLSRYGVHSFPSLFLQNQTSRVRYHGSRDLESLVIFYKEMTGIEPIISDYLVHDYGNSFRSHFSNDYGQNKEHSPYPWEMSPRKLIQQEPYLISALLFLTMRVLVYLLPKVVMWIKQYRLECMWHINLALLSENTSPFLKHALHMINLNRIWSRLQLSKSRNFQEGSKNARVWASSLASVSLGKGPLNRPGSSNESG